MNVTETALEIIAELSPSQLNEIVTKYENSGCDSEDNLKEALDQEIYEQAKEKLSFL